MNVRPSPAHRAEAHAVGAWAHARTPDELGALADTIWSLGHAAPGLGPELVERARALMETNLSGDADPRDPRPLVALAELLERAAETLRAAARIMDRDGPA